MFVKPCSIVALSAPPAVIMTLPFCSETTAADFTRLDEYGESRTSTLSSLMSFVYSCCTRAVVVEGDLRHEDGAVLELDAAGLRDLIDPELDALGLFGRRDLLGARLRVGESDVQRLADRGCGAAACGWSARRLRRGRPAARRGEETDDRDRDDACGSHGCHLLRVFDPRPFSYGE